MKIQTAKKLVKAWEIFKLIFAICMLVLIIIGVILLFINFFLPMLIIMGLIAILIGWNFIEYWWIDVVNLSHKEETNTKETNENNC